MRTTTLLLTGLLVLGTVAAAPAASAHHVMYCDPGAPKVCHETVSPAVNNLGHRIECFYDTPPEDWKAVCL